jgi:hypothetical protein
MNQALPKVLLHTFSSGYTLLSQIGVFQSLSYIQSLWLSQKIEPLYLFFALFFDKRDFGFHSHQLSVVANLHYVWQD